MERKSSVKRKRQVQEITCSAPVNIAVIKYWGKRDTALLLPTNSSLSLTLSQDHLKTTTTIRAAPEFEDTIYLNGKKQDIHAKRLNNVISQSRELRRQMEEHDQTLEKLSEWGIIIASFNNFPTAAGLASSASGFACLAFALAKLYNLPSSDSEISKVARIGSGSACRSLFGGFVNWEQGDLPSGDDSLAIQVASEKDWPDMEALILVVSDAQKDVGSTVGMQETVKTSDLLQHRIKNVVPKRMIEMENAIKNKDFDKFAELTMKDSNQFHACCLDTFPPIFYLNDISKAIIKVITAYNSLFLKEVDGKSIGYQVCYTFDAGPNAVLYLPKKNVPTVLGLLNYLFPFSGKDEKEYFGRAAEFILPDQKRAREIAQELGLKTYPVNSVARIISTVVGDGPRIISNEFGGKGSLLNEENQPKQL